MSLKPKPVLVDVGGNGALNPPPAEDIGFFLRGGGTFSLSSTSVSNKSSASAANAAAVDDDPWDAGEGEVARARFRRLGVGDFVGDGAPPLTASPPVDDDESVDRSLFSDAERVTGPSSAKDIGLSTISGEGARRRGRVRENWGVDGLAVVSTESFDAEREDVVGLETSEEDEDEETEE